MRKQLFFRLGVLLLILALLPVTVFAGAINTAAACSLTLHYTKAEAVFPELEIEIRRVAGVTSYGYFELTEPYASWPVNIHGITSQAEWKAVTQTLCAYITAEHTPADHTGKTDENGTVVFPELETGMYLVSGVRAENENAVYQFDPFLVCLPTPTGDGGQNYHVEARPKCSEYTPKTEYQVLKLWKDRGYTRQRPKSVTVEIYRDGVLFDTVVLSSTNNWTHRWKVEGSGDWTVIETDLPSKYKVSITSQGTVFTITNTYNSPPEEPPKTGDTFPWQAYMTAMCLSGCLLVILGIFGRRKKQ